MQKVRSRAEAARSLPASETEVEMERKKRAKQRACDCDQKSDYRLAGIRVLYHVETKYHHDGGE